MFRAFVLVCGCLLQSNLVTTEGHRGTNRHVFYAVQMDGGIRAARTLAEQHGLEYIQRVSACLKLLLLPPYMALQFQHPVSGAFFFPFFPFFFFSRAANRADFHFLLEGYLTLIKLQQHF